SSPYAVVIAGLSALQGLRHGGSTERAEALLEELDDPSKVERGISDRLRRGELIPGFGHKLYPDGDPRGAQLLRMLERTYPNSPVLIAAQTIITTVRDAIDQAPNIDFAMGVLSRTLDLPSGSGLSIFSLGRTVGLIGHAIEQHANGDLIRPRASY